MHGIILWFWNLFGNFLVDALHRGVLVTKWMDDEGQIPCRKVQGGNKSLICLRRLQFLLMKASVCG